MLTGIDHFIVVVPEPEEAAGELERELGLHVSPGGRHAAWGSFNRLIWLGDTYIELLGIADRRLAAQAWFGPEALKVLDESGAGYIGLSLASDDLDAEMSALHAQGSALGAADAGERARPDGGVVRWKTATAAQADPELGHVFLIEHDPTGAEWTREDRRRRSGDVHPLGGPVRLVRVELPVRDMKSTTMRLHRDVGLAFRPSLAGGGARETSVGSQSLRLVRAGPGMMPTVVLRGGPRPHELEAFGCRWIVEPQPD